MGEGHVRVALIEYEARIRQAVRGIKAMFKADEARRQKQADAANGRSVSFVSKL